MMIIIVIIITIIITGNAKETNYYIKVSAF